MWNQIRCSFKTIEVSSHQGKPSEISVCDELIAFSLNRPECNVLCTWSHFQVSLDLRKSCIVCQCVRLVEFLWWLGWTWALERIHPEWWIKAPVPHVLYEFDFLGDFLSVSARFSKFVSLCSQSHKTHCKEAPEFRSETLWMTTACRCSEFFSAHHVCPIAWQAALKDGELFFPVYYWIGLFLMFEWQQHVLTFPQLWECLRSANRKTWHRDLAVRSGSIFSIFSVWDLDGEGAELGWHNISGKAK